MGVRGGEGQFRYFHALFIKRENGKEGGRERGKGREEGRKEGRKEGMMDGSTMEAEEGGDEWIREEG